MQHISTENMLVQIQTLCHCSSHIIVFIFSQERKDVFDYMYKAFIAFIKCNLFNKMPQNIAPCTKKYVVLRREEGNV
jgi:hypothetical protein